EPRARQCRRNGAVACDVVAFGAADRHPIQAGAEDSRVLREPEAGKRREANDPTRTCRAAHSCYPPSRKLAVGAVYCEDLTGGESGDVRVDAPEAEPLARHNEVMGSPRSPADFTALRATHVARQRRPPSAVCVPGHVSMRRQFATACLRPNNAAPSTFELR